MMNWYEIELARLRREDRYREAAEGRLAQQAGGADGVEVALRYASALFALGLIVLAMLAG